MDRSFSQGEVVAYPSTRLLQERSFLVKLFTCQRAHSPTGIKLLPAPACERINKSFHLSRRKRGFHNPFFKYFFNFFIEARIDFDIACCVRPSDAAISSSLSPSTQYSHSLLRCVSVRQLSKPRITKRLSPSRSSACACSLIESSTEPTATASSERPLKESVLSEY